MVFGLPATALVLVLSILDLDINIYFAELQLVEFLRILFGNLQFGLLRIYQAIIESVLGHGACHDIVCPNHGGGSGHISPIGRGQRGG